MKIVDNQYTKTTIRKKGIVIPQVRTIMRYGTGSIILFNCAERNSLVKQSEQSPAENVSMGDSVQTGSHDTYLSRFALSYGMTVRG